jgi:glutamate racemase
VHKAAVFDSGIGGLSVVKSLLKHKLFDEIVYFGDTARVPYGIKDKNTIIRYSLEALEFFKNFEVDILITACNSVSAYAIEELKENAPFPVIGVIEAGVTAIQEKIKNKKAKILIIGTTATISSKKYEKLLIKKGYTNLIPKATPLFVPIVEEGIFEGEILEAAMRYYFKSLPHPEAIVLGCTHFPLISKKIENYFHNSAIMIHSGEAIAEELEKNFNLKKRKRATNLKLFSSENPEKLKQIAKIWLKQ